MTTSTKSPESSPSSELEVGSPRKRCWLHHGDYLPWLSSLPDASVDLVITDYPYESLEKHRKVGTTTRLKKSDASSNEWFGVIPNSDLPKLMEELYRVLKKKTHCYMFCDDETSDFLKKAGQEAGFHCWKRLVWNKEAMGMGYHYRATYEFIVFFEKGTKKAVPGKYFAGTRQLSNRGVSDILSHKRIKSKDAYPTEKPLSLMEVLILNSANDGDIVIDPFMGSGVVGQAAIRNLCRFWGNDISPTSLRHAKRKIRPEMKATRNREM